MAETHQVIEQSPSTLELVKHDTTAQAPQLDHPTQAMNSNRSAPGLEVHLFSEKWERLDWYSFKATDGEGPEVFLRRSLPEPLNDIGNHYSNHVNDDSQTTKICGLRWSPAILLGLIFVLVFAVIGTGLGVKFRTENNRTG